MTDIDALHNALISWFEAEKEDLPWRRSADPYAIWLSEIMLQQTQVATVIPYYERFLARFPTVSALAAAPLDDVLKLWEGLGYYSRARNLHRAARVVVDEFGGQFPPDVDDLRRLPGVGPYTAGAVGSLAFGLDVPLLDGNVIRILTRLFDLDGDVTRPAVRRDLWALVADILPAGRAAAWNEGLMELGRRICTPRVPRCDACPVAEGCKSLAHGTQEDRPVKTRKARTPHYDVAAGVIRHPDGRVLIAQRLPDRLLGGLWEFPGGKVEPGETLADCLRREIREELGIEIAVGGQLLAFKHAYTHFRITLYVFDCDYLSGEPRAIECANWAWVTLDEMDAYAFPSTDQKIIAALRGESGQLAMEFPGQAG